MHDVEPQIFLIAETGLAPGYNTMLRALGADWSSDADSASEALVETAGRACYMSFPKVGGGYVNSNVSRHRRANKDYLKNILAEGDGSILEHATSTWAFLEVHISRA